MKKSIYKCLDSIEICGNQLKCRFDLNNWFVLHNHDFWEIMIVLDGTYNQTLNNTPLIMPKYSAILLRPSDTHILHPGDPTDNHLNIVINCAFMKELCDFFDSSLYQKLSTVAPTPFYLTNSQQANMATIARELQLYPPTEQPSHLKRMLVSFFLNLYQIQFHLKNKDYPPEFQSLFEQISNPLNISMTVNDMVKSTGYSYSHFAKLFKSITGISANEFLTNKKLDYACYALQKTNISISQLCYTLGFQNPGYFTNLFKKYYGLTPSRYREKYLHNPV